MKTLTHLNSSVSDFLQEKPLYYVLLHQSQLYRKGAWKRGAPPVNHTPTWLLGGKPVMSSTRVLAGDPVTAVVCKVGATRTEIPLRSD